MIEISVDVLHGEAVDRTLEYRLVKAVLQNGAYPAGASAGSARLNVVGDLVVEGPDGETVLGPTLFGTENEYRTSLAQGGEGWLIVALRMGDEERVLVVHNQYGHTGRRVAAAIWYAPVGLANGGPATREAVAAWLNRQAAVA